MSLRRFLVALLLLAAPLAALAQGLGPDLRELERQLRLDPMQKSLFDEAAAATQRAMLATGLAALGVKSRIDEELRQPAPDLGRMLGDPEDLIDQVRPQWREARDAWSALYATLDERQLAIARAEIERRFRMLEGAAGRALKGRTERPGL
jgi:hypothetical protein